MKTTTTPPHSLTVKILDARCGTRTVIVQVSETHRESYPPCIATAEEIRDAIEEVMWDDPPLLVEGHAPDELGYDDWSDWIDDRIDEMQSLLSAPSAEVDAILLAGRDRALAWLQDRHPPSAFLDVVATHEELLLCCCWEFSLAFFRGEFAANGVMQ